MRQIAKAESWKTDLIGMESCLLVMASRWAKREAFAPFIAPLASFAALEGSQHGEASASGALRALASDCDGIAERLRGDVCGNSGPWRVA